MSGVVTSLARISLILILLLASLPAHTVDGRMAASLDSAVAEAIRLSELEARGDASGLYRTLHPDAKKIISQKTVEGWYQNEFFPLQPQPIIEIVSAEYVTWTWGVSGETYDQTAQVTFIQPFGTGTNQYNVTETVRLVKAGNGQWSWFFGRSRDFIDQQQTIYDPAPPQRKTSNSATRTTRSSRSKSGSNTSSSSASRNTSTSNTRNTPSSKRIAASHPSSTRDCTLVELAPGYPGYRGLVTGLSQNYGGLADWACLEDLARNNPGFNRDEQDRQNHKAAQSLGISGGPTDWLWENWMAIEAHRGLPTNCYSCLMFDTTVIPINTSITQNWTDPRVRVGFIGSVSAVNEFLPTPQMRSRFVDNYQLRAHAFLAAGPSANATDILQIYQRVGEGEFWDGFFDVDYILRTGGYAWVTSDAYPQDQIFSVEVAFAAASFQLVPPARSSVKSQLDDAILRWQADRATGSTESLVQFLRRDWSS